MPLVGFLILHSQIGKTVDSESTGTGSSPVGVIINDFK